MIRARRHRGLHLPLARRPPASAIRHGRDPRLRLQTRIEHTLGARGAHPGDGQRTVHALRRRPARSPSIRAQMLDENKWLAARHGLDAELVDLPHSERIARGRSPAADRAPARRMPRTSARSAELEAIDDLLDRGNGSARQIARLRGEPRLPRGHGRDRGAATVDPGSFVRLATGWVRPFEPPDASTGARSLCRLQELWLRGLSPYITECPYCGNRLRKRAPKLERDRPNRRAAPAPRPDRVAPAAPGRDPRHPGRLHAPPYATIVLAHRLHGGHRRDGRVHGLPGGRRREAGRRVVAHRQRPVLLREPLVRRRGDPRDRAVRRAARTAPRPRHRRRPVLHLRHGRDRGGRRDRVHPWRWEPTAPRSGCLRRGRSGRRWNCAAAGSPTSI